MNFDYFCAVSERHEDDFEKLSKLESLYDEVKGDKNQRKKINALYKNFSTTNPSLIYQYLDLHGQCNAEKFRSYWIEKWKKLCGLDVFKSFERQFIPKLTTEYISMLPKHSFFLQFNFTLAAPYISRDDEEFYICDNPIRKDKVFKIPMISGSSWKGNIRWTAMKIFTDDLPEVIDKHSIGKCFDSRARVVRLFGHEKAIITDYLDSALAEAMSGDDKSQEKFRKFLVEKGYMNINVDGRRGRLNFYPTFFNQIGLEVINPHDRETKAGTLPIYIESVPVDADGTFSLLYVPFDLMGKPEGKAKKEMADDLELIRAALKDMMLIYGFSAKKSCGFGVAKNELSDIFCEMNGIEIKKSPEKYIKQKYESMSFDNLESKIKAIIDELLNAGSSYSGENNV